MWKLIKEEKPKSFKVVPLYGTVNIGTEHEKKNTTYGYYEKEYDWFMNPFGNDPILKESTNITHWFDFDKVEKPTI